MTERQRKDLIGEIAAALPQALMGSISETYRRCGNPNCRCHHGGAKHGPHLYVSYRGASGKTTGYYVPESAHEAVRTGVQTWSQIQKRLRELSAANKERLIPPKPMARARKSAG